MTDAQPSGLAVSGGAPSGTAPYGVVPAACGTAPVVHGTASVGSAPTPAPALHPLFGEDFAATGDELQDRLAEWVSDFTSLHEHIELLAHAKGLDAALAAVLESGAALLGARRGLITTTARGAGQPVGLGLDRCGIGALETVPVEHGPFAGLLGRTGGPGRLLIADLAADPAAGPRFREVAAQLGLGACFALPLGDGDGDDGPLGAAAWFYDEPAEPSPRHQQLLIRYCEFAAPVLAGQLAADRTRRATDALRRGLLPDRLPIVPGVRLAARCVAAGLDSAAGSDWYDAVELPDGTLAVTVGSVSGDGPGAGPSSAPGAAAAMGRVRAALRAYAVLEGEDPVSVLGDLELLLKTTEPARTATAVYGWVQPEERRVTLAGAGHCPPILVHRDGADFVETSLSAPLGVLSCWEAPGVELTAGPGDVLVLYTEGMARRCGPTLHSGQSVLRRAAADAPRDARTDPDRLCAHLLEATGGTATGTDDLVLLALRFG